MKNIPIQIHFSKSSKYDNNVNFDVCAILFALDNNDYINVVLNEKQTIEDINLLIIQLTEKLEQNRLLKKYQQLQAENEDLLNIKQKAQSQAIRIALINKVSNTIRESIDILLSLNFASATKSELVIFCI